ncbi:hypothetical protein HY837_04245 [archaeon]|nr:hypothetical protein [archaeon]
MSSIEPDPNPAGVIKQLGLKDKLDAYFKNNTFTSKAYVIPVGKMYIIGSHEKLSKILQETGREDAMIREVEKTSIDYLISREYNITRNDLRKGNTRRFKKN